MSNLAVMKGMGMSNMVILKDARMSNLKGVRVKFQFRDTWKLTSEYH